MKKQSRFILLIMLLVIFYCFPVYAYTDNQTSIQEVNITVNVDGRITPDTVNVTNETPNTTLSNINIRAERNTIEIYLKSDENCYFGLTKASEVKLTGVNYMKAVKQEKSTLLKIIVTKSDGGQWLQDEKGWFYQRPDGTHPAPGWYVALKDNEDDKIFRYYYFTEGGYRLESSGTPDGYWVNENGEFTKVITQPNYGTDEDDAPV